MFLRANIRKKDGKLHRYWSVVESRRTADDRVMQRQGFIWGRSTIASLQPMPAPCVAAGAAR
jgi:hypothetical protein